MLTPSSLQDGAGSYSLVATLPYAAVAKGACLSLRVKLLAQVLQVLSVLAAHISHAELQALVLGLLSLQASCGISSCLSTLAWQAVKHAYGCTSLH